MEYIYYCFELVFTLSQAGTLWDNTSSQKIEIFKMQIRTHIKIITLITRNMSFY